MTRKGQNFHLMTSHFNIPGFQRQRNPSSLPVKKASFFWSKMAARAIVFRTDLSEKSAKGFNFCFFEVSTRRQGRVGQAEPARTKSCWCKWITSKKFVNIWKCFQYNYVNFAIKCQITSVEKTLFFCLFCFLVEVTSNDVSPFRHFTPHAQWHIFTSQTEFWTWRKITLHSFIVDGRWWFSYSLIDGVSIFCRTFKEIYITWIVYTPERQLIIVCCDGQMIGLAFVRKPKWNDGMKFVFFEIILISSKHPFKI